jgi:hypothetical protein
LCGEVFDQFDLFVSERTNFLAIDDYGTNELAFLEHWNTK